MEQLNRIELRGNIGFLRTNKVNGRTVANFSVATNYVYKGKDGDPVIETTWHNVCAWEGRQNQCLDKLERGSKVHVVGRVRNQSYTDAEGITRNVSEVMAFNIEILDGMEQLQYEIQ